LTRAGALAAQPRGPGDIRMRDLVPERRPFMRLIRLALPSFVMFIVGLWRISGPSFWRDEAATMSAIRRPLPVLWQMLGKTDVVHGAYYLLMWPLVRVLGTSELGARLPSVVAVAAAAGGVAAIGRRLASERAGLAAGLAFALFPVASRYGQEARSYALVMALAVLASYLLVRATDMDTGSRSWWLAYSATLAAMGWMNLMSLLIVPAHAVPFGQTGADIIVGGAATIIMVACGLAVGWRAHDGVARTAAGFALLLLFRYAMSWTGVYVGLALSNEKSVGNLSPLIFPLTMVANTFVPTTHMPTWLRTIANWNPISALTAALRQLFGNPGASLGHASLPLQHPIIATLAWSVALIAVFGPLAVRSYVRSGG
jgi:ABC-2 type transport system permease protein